jgi:hypothetical protein
MKTKRTGKPAKVEHGLLLDMARTIGSTLGSLAAKTGAPSRLAASPARVKRKTTTRARTRKKRKA